MFIRHSHLVCLRLNKSKKRNIVMLGSKQDLTTALEEVCTDVCCDWIHKEL